MLSTIQDMKFFLRTGFGDSKAYAGSTDGKKTQGLCQGNGAAPAGWTVTTIAMLKAHRRKGHGVHLLCPISRRMIHLAGTLFVDDTDLKHFEMNRAKTPSKAHAALQSSIHNWGRLLIATGGALKPAKCFYHLISFSWTMEGKWRYDANDKRTDLDIVVPLEDRTLTSIEHLPVTAPTKTLGQMTCPTGSSSGAIAQMQEKAQGWVAKARESKLHKGHLNFLLDKQFWPGVLFGISSVCARFKELEECLMKTYYNMLPLCGIRRSVRNELRQLDRGFYGIGLPHPGVECFVAQINKILMHYGCSSGLGIHMQVSMEMMIIEGGISTQILSEPYTRYGKRVTYCWLRLLWEKVDMFCFCIEIRELALATPRENDGWIMLAFVDLGFTDDELIGLNRAQCHQQVIFTSDVFDASGRALDRQYLERQQAGKVWSTLLFPLEQPSVRDFRLWKSTLYSLAPRGRPAHWMGRFVKKGHKIWEWRYDPDRSRLCHL
jgi:hypothetical protein